MSGDRTPQCAIGKPMRRDRESCDRVGCIAVAVRIDVPRPWPTGYLTQSLEGGLAPLRKVHLLHGDNLPSTKLDGNYVA